MRSPSSCLFGRVKNPSYILLLLLANSVSAADNWPRWRGQNGNAVSPNTALPVVWSSTNHIAWSVEITGEGASSPIIWDDTIFLTAATDQGGQRLMHCLDRTTGALRWTRSIEDKDPELSSALTGHAASTPVTDGTHVIAFFGNAGLVCWDFHGNEIWHYAVRPFESELGFASSPILIDERVIMVCDHDGDKFSSFESYLLALDKRNGKERWKVSRPELFRSWSTPIAIPSEQGNTLIVSAQEEVRGYHLDTGEMLWSLRGMTGWVTPSPLWDGKYLYVTSGRDGPIMCVRPPQNRGEKPEITWKHETGGPYVCSPVLYHGRLYVLDEQGILRCMRAETGELLYRERLDGKFFASGIAGAGHLYFCNDTGITYVVKDGDHFQLAAENDLEEEILASPAASQNILYLRTRTKLYAISSKPPSP